MSTPRQRKPSVAPKITLEAAIPEETARSFWRLYLDTFGDLATKAVARQVLHEDEFMEEMTDARVDKYIAWDEQGEAVGLCTLTNQLETVPWISPDYFAHHYPEAHERGAIYYFGFILVHQAHRRHYLFSDLIGVVAELIIAEDAVCAWDICHYNNDVLGLSEALDLMLNRVADVPIDVIDTQTYYAGKALGRRQMPRMREAESPATINSSEVS